MGSPYLLTVIDSHAWSLLIYLLALFGTLLAWEGVS
jgi:hypothetical protein